jgi:hypothetical protein
LIFLVLLYQVFSSFYSQAGKVTLTKRYPRPSF